MDRRDLYRVDPSAGWTGARHALFTRAAVLWPARCQFCGRLWVDAVAKHSIRRCAYRSHWNRRALGAGRAGESDYARKGVKAAEESLTVVILSEAKDLCIWRRNVKVFPFRLCSGSR